MTTETKPKTKMAKGAIKVKPQHRTIYLSKLERYVISQSVQYWLDKAPKNPLETILIDKIKEVGTKFKTIE